MALNDGPARRDGAERSRSLTGDQFDFPANPKSEESGTNPLAELRAATLDKYRNASAVDTKPDKKDEGSIPARVSEIISDHLKEATEVVNDKKGFSWKDTAKKLWGVWERLADRARSPWNIVVKYGLPAALVATGAVCYQAVAQLGVETLSTLGNLFLPVAAAGLFVVPTVAANKIWDKCEKILKVDPVSPWIKHAIIKPLQFGLVVGGAIWAQTMHLSMMSYSAWAAAIVGTGYLASKIPQIPRRTVWAAGALALALPWGHLATMRSYDVTVLSAGPDPEVAAWNVGTDLSVTDHWKGIFGLGTETAPSGKTGMVLINRDVPLFIPPHRSANAFNSDFSNLIGKRVRVTTIGGWLKLFSPKLQPTIVKYEVLDK